MMRSGMVVLVTLLSIGSTGVANGMSTEELLFEKHLYAEAAQAAGQGDGPALEKFIKKGIDINYEGKETRGPWGKDTVTLLLWATLSESVRGVEALLKVGADPNKGTRRGMTPLMIASSRKNDELFELLLLRYKADPNKIFGVPNETALTMVLKERKSLG